MRPLLFVLCATALAFVPVSAPQAQPGTPAQCAAIEADAERLACYDAIFRGGGDNGEAEAIVIESERMIPALPTGRAPATMTLSCAEAGPLVAFAFAGQLVSATGDIAPVTFQIDQSGTIVRTLRADETNKSLSFAAGRESDTFLEGLAGGTNLKVRMTPVRQRSVTVDFRLDDHADAIAALRASCQPR